MIRTSNTRFSSISAILAGVFFLATTTTVMAVTPTRLYIVAGQSNAMGQTSLNSELSHQRCNSRKTTCRPITTARGNRFNRAWA